MANIKIFDPQKQIFERFVGTLSPADVVEYRNVGSCSSVMELLSHLEVLHSEGYKIDIKNEEWLANLANTRPEFIIALRDFGNRMRRDKTTVGLAEVRANGVQLGRKRINQSQRLNDKIRKAIELHNDGASVVEACRAAGCKPIDYYRRRKQLS